jgi:hypothetical protein
MSESLVFQTSVKGRASCQVQVAHAILPRKLNLEAGGEDWFAAIRGANISVHSLLDTTDHGQEKAKSAAM